MESETEGNVFFVVEVVRALAEEAGLLSTVGQMQLPERVYAGGIRAVVQRRLVKVPESAHRLLTIAAITGRQIDQRLLKHFAADSSIEDWLTVCANAAVLDILDEQWRFAHDKLREGLIEMLEPEDLRQLHAEAAQALELVYASEQDEYAGMIADHHEKAGAPLKAADWHLRAGKHAENTFVYGAAIDRYRRAQAIWQHEADPGPQQLIELYRGLGRMHNRLAEYAEAIEAYQDMLRVAEQAKDQAAQAFAWHGIAWAYIHQGDFRHAVDSATMCEQIARPADAAHELNEGLLVQGWSTLSLGDPAAALTLADEATQIAETLGDQGRLANSLNLLGAVRCTMGRYDIGQEVFERALSIAETLGDRQSATTLVSNLGLVASTRGDYEGAVERFEEALAFARQSGARNSQISYLYNIGNAQVMLGDYAAAEDSLRAVFETAQGIEFREISATYRALAEALLKQDRLEAARDAALQALAKGREAESPEYIAGAWRVLGQILASTGDLFEDSAEQPLRSFDARACFAESDRIFSELGMDDHLALTLRRWAEYELRYGSQDEGLSLWQRARDTYQKIGADLEAERMADGPLHNSRR